MIHPRVLFIGDPAAAAPYVGIAKKLARQTFNARIRSKTYKLGDATIRVENTLPAKETFGEGYQQMFGGICKVWIQAGKAELVYQFGCTTPTVTYVGDPENTGYFPSWLYTSNLYCVPPNITDKPDKKIRVDAYGSAIEYPGEQGGWKYRAAPMPLVDWIKFNRKGINHQIQGVNEPVFWQFEPDEVIATLPEDKKYTPTDGRVYTFFVQNGRQLFSGMSLNSATNTVSDQLYDERGTLMGKGRVSPRSTRSPDSDWYQTSGLIKTSKGLYEFGIDASNVFRIWFLPKTDYSVDYTIAEYEYQSFVFNVTDPTVVQIILPENSVVPEMQFREFYRLNDGLSAGSGINPTPRYHWKVRHDGKKIAAIINIREPMVDVPTFKRWIIAHDLYAGDPTLLQTDFGAAYRTIGAADTFIECKEKDQAINKERTAIVVYSIDLQEATDESFSVSITLDSVSPVYENQMPFSVGFAEPHAWTNGVVDGDLLAAYMSLSRDETMKFLAEYSWGGENIIYGNHKAVVTIENVTSSAVLHQFCVSDSDFNSTLSIADEPKERFIAKFQYMNLSTLSFSINLRHEERYLSDDIKEVGASNDWYQGLLTHSGGIIVYAYGGVIEDTTSDFLKGKLNAITPHVYALDSEYLTNYYYVAQQDTTDMLSPEWWLADLYYYNAGVLVGSGGISIGSSITGVITKPIFSNLIIDNNYTPSLLAETYPTYFPCTVSDFVQGVIDLLWKKIEWFSAINNNRTIDYALVYYCCVTNPGLSNFFTGNGSIYSFGFYDVIKKIAHDNGVSKSNQRRFNDFSNSFYIENYPMGNHHYLSAINGAFDNCSYSDIITFPGKYPHVSYYASPIIYYNGDIPFLAVGVRDGMVVSYNYYVYPDEFAKLSLDNFYFYSPDGIVFNLGHANERRSTHLSMYNEAYKHTYEMNDFFDLPLELYNGNYLTGVYVKLEEGNWVPLVSFFGGYAPYSISTKKGNPPLYPLLRCNATFTYL